MQRLAEFMDQAELADRLGYDTYWVAEIHCQPKFSLMSAPYVALGAVAQRTKKLRLGVAVNDIWETRTGRRLRRRRHWRSSRTR